MFRNRTRTIALGSIAALTLAAAPVSAFAATSHPHERAASITRGEHSRDRASAHVGKSLDRKSLDRKSLDRKSLDRKSLDKKSLDTSRSDRSAGSKDTLNR